jgi:thiosulfate/3-mercaptopyruvate sulfurtransferase
MKVTRAFIGALALAATVLAKENPNALVNLEWLDQHAQDTTLRLIEVSVDPGLYEKGHIPGAVNVSWHKDLVDQPRRDIVSKEQFEALASRLGITRNTTVVLYGDNNNWFAAWGYWIFKVYGHPDVRLLDGGRKKWEFEKRPLATTAPTLAASQYKASKANIALRARLKDVVDVAEGRKPAVLVDIRSPDEYAGKIIAPPGIQELAIRAGHVPTAVNIPWGTSVNQEDGTFKSKEDLRKAYAEKGVDGKKPIIAYCRIGERSAHSWFVLSQILGYEVKQYDGSWTEYGNAVGVPITNLAGLVWTGK